MSRIVPGQRYGRLTVLEYVRTEPPRKKVWRCICDCGRLKETRGESLRSGRTTSCNCRLGQAGRTHGATATTKPAVGYPTYQVWKNMKARCLNPRHKQYQHYGGRGISICERWLVFDNFSADMGLRPPGKSIDRIDVNGNYEPGNCRWATQAEQARNRRCNRFIEHQGERLCVADWAYRLGIPSGTLYHRLKRGMTFEEAVVLRVL